MLTAAAVTAAGAAMALLLANPGFASSSSSGDDDDGIAVSPGWAGWIDTEVTDSGALDAAETPPASSRPPARTCAQSKSQTAGGYATEQQFDSGVPPDARSGGWVIRRCSDGTLDTAWVPVRPEALTLEQLAHRAVNRLPLPVPQPSFEPRRQSSAGPATLVAIPTSFFLDGWGAITQRTEAGGMWAVVTAEPVAAMWWPGDGGPPVRCTSADQARRADRPGTACTHTYRRSSAAQANNVYLGRVVVTWRVRWSGSGGLTGTLPLMERQTTFPVAVAERQTVIVAGGGDR